MFARFDANKDSRITQAEVAAAPRPPAGAAAADGARGARGGGFLLRMDANKDGAVTRADGSYSIAVPPGPGFLLVKSPEPDFIQVETTTGRLDGAIGGTPYFLHAVEPLRLAPAAAPRP